MGGAFLVKLSTKMNKIETKLVRVGFTPMPYLSVKDEFSVKRVMEIYLLPGTPN